MTIQVGDRIPDVPLSIASAEGPQPTTSGEFFAGKRVALFAVPGAFTPTCSARHLPSYVDKAGDLKGKGIDEIACISVNDPFVMAAWGKHMKVDGTVRMLADGSAKYVKELGLELDLTGRGMGVRSNRYAMIVDKGVVKGVYVEAPGKYEVSSAESVLTHL